MRTIKTDSVGLGVLVIPPPVAPSYQPIEFELLANANPKQLGFLHAPAHTCVCFLKFRDDGCMANCYGTSGVRRRLPQRVIPDSFETVASAPSVTPKTNRALHDVNSAKVGEELQGWGNPGNETVLDPSYDASVPVDRELTRTYSSRTAGQTRTDSLNLYGWRVSGIQKESKSLEKCR